MNLEQTRLDLIRMIDDFKVGIQRNLIDQIKEAMRKNEIFLIKAAVEANNRQIDSAKACDLNQLTKRVMEHDTSIKEIQYRSNPYVLSETVRILSDRCERMEQSLNQVKNKMEEFETTKFLDTSITSEELKSLYASSGYSHTEVAKFLKVEPSRFYQIINGQEKNPDYIRRSKLKKFFMRKINASA
jgi:arsenate reductase-like glutaredoxin family protein